MKNYSYVAWKSNKLSVEFLRDVSKDRGAQVQQ